MHRLPTIPFERPMPVQDELEESGESNDESRLTHLKLGTAWLCATLAGVAALAYATISHTSPPVTMAALAVLLVAYAGYGYSLPQKNTIQFADSLYYMGFLWGIFSLIATFVIWPSPKLTTDAVLTTFGYALVATFCGMLLRLVLIQFRDDTLPDRLVHAQERVDRRVTALIQEINEATMEITTFRDRAATDLGGTLHDLVQSLTAVREKLTEQHRTMAKAMSEGFESSLKDILGRLSAIQIPQELLTGEVAKLVATLGKQEESFDKAAQRLEKSLMHAAETVTLFGDSLDRSEGARQVGIAVNDLSNKIKERTEQFVKMTTTFEQGRAELDGQLNSLQSLRSAVSIVATRLSAFETELRELSPASMSAEVRTGLMNVQQAIRSSLEGSKAIESMMRDVLLFMRERVTEEPSSERH
jgi:uncharacterized coiled-coil DUF342 family protein